MRKISKLSEWRPSWNSAKWQPLFLCLSTINQCSKMENLVIQSPQGRDVTTSLIVAEVFGKDHRKVCRDIESLSCSDEFRVANFGHTPYIHPQNGQEYHYYEMTKDGFSFLVMGYTGKKAGEFKEMFINEFNKREMMLKSDDYILARSQEILRNRLLVAEKQLESAKATIELQSEQLKEQAPKVEYTDSVLNATNTYTSTQMAKELNLRTAEQLHALLKTWGVMIRQSGQWMLAAKYCGQNYTKTRTHSYTKQDGTQGTNSITVWTERGRWFLHQLMQQKGGVK